MKITVSTIRKMKTEGKKIVMLTACDAPTAHLAAGCGIDMLQVGDSVGMCSLGYKDMLHVTLEESLHHRQGDGGCRSVCSGAGVRPAELGKSVTEALSIPTIGIGAGPYCSGQVQVVNDTLGFFDGPKPKHAKQDADLNTIIGQALGQYAGEVRNGILPGEENSF